MIFTDAGNSSGVGLFVSGDVQIFINYFRSGEAFVCYGSKVFRFHGGNAIGNRIACMDLVLFFTLAYRFYLAGDVVLSLYLYDRKSTEEIYARTERG